MPRHNIAELGRPSRFTSENQPKRRGRPLGSRNRQTIIREYFSLEREMFDLVRRAKGGDKKAQRELLELVYRLADEQQSGNEPAAEGASEWSFPEWPTLEGDSEWSFPEWPTLEGW